MAVERLAESVNLTTGHRFYVLHGPGVHDVFIGQDYRQLDIEEAMHTWLKESGFERIAYYLPRRGVHFRDSLSLQHSRPESGQSVPQKPSGPSRRSVLRPQRSPEPTPSREAPLGPLTGVMGIRLLDQLLREDSPRSAVVIRQTETSLRHFRQPDLLVKVLGEWVSLPPANRNICLFLMGGSNEDITAGLQEWPELHAEITRCRMPAFRNVAYLGGPDAGELQRLVDYIRLARPQTNGQALRIHWHQRTKLVRRLAAENELARQWLVRLHQVEELDLETCRRQQWSQTLQGLDGRTAEQRLESMTGLALVKKRIADLADYAAEEMERRNQGLPGSEAPTLHLVFTGNPGTGKSTVARLIGEMYADMGLLKRGHTVEVESAADLVADHVGGTAIRTNTKINEAIGGVLFIDEAYQLVDAERGRFGQEAIDTILTRMENERGSFVLITAGYTGPMQDFLASNQGLRRRFPPENIVEFPDSAPDELFEILIGMLRERGRQIAPEDQQTIKEVVEGLYFMRTHEFGNAGEMRNLADSLIKSRSVRGRREKLSLTAPIQAIDISEYYKAFLKPPIPTIEDLLAELNGFIGLEPVKVFVSEALHVLRLEQHMRERGIDALPRTLHMAFIGNPGTGKTTVARLMGKILLSLGLLRKGHVIETKGSELIAGYIGQSATQTAQKLEQALDGVLFIDEAYALDDSSEQGYGRDVIQELITQMENQRERLVVIVAGYPDKMEHLWATNAGLRGRFMEPIEFPDYSEEELMQIMADMVLKRGFTLADGVVPEARRYLQVKRERSPYDFDNARAVRTLVERMQGRYATRVSRELASLEKFVFEAIDVPQNS